MAMATWVCLNGYIKRDNNFNVERGECSIIGEPQCKDYILASIMYVFLA